MSEDMKLLSQNRPALHSQRYSDPCRVASIALVIPRHQCDRRGAGCLPPWSPGTASCHHGPVTICSAKGCSSPANHLLVWNNPRLHTPDREKTWLACDEHRQSLSDFLGARGFLKDVVPHTTG